MEQKIPPVGTLIHATPNQVGILKGHNGLNSVIRIQSKGNAWNAVDPNLQKGLFVFIPPVESNAEFSSVIITSLTKKGTVAFGQVQK
jgi:hypothetical protein